MINENEQNTQGNHIPVKLIIVLLGIFVLIAVAAIVLIIKGGASDPVPHLVWQMLSPKGPIAAAQKKLLITAVLIMCVIILPAVATAFIVAFKYRAENSTADYQPEWKHSKLLQFFIWLFPCVIIFSIAVINWKTSHQLDPFRQIASANKPITIQVVALEWKWLFIYPEQNIATVNFVEFPENTPVSFELTADAPMNSFWIPQLGGQMYAMAGMSTQLHLMATESGEFRGSAAEINGEGFSGMNFIAKSASKTDFDAWVQTVKKSQNKLDGNQYTQLSQPSENNPKAEYALTEKNLYNEVMEKYMSPAATIMEHYH